MRPHQIPLKINSEVHMLTFIKEFWSFLAARKKFWLAPIMIVMILLGSMLIAVQGSVVAPFIYALF